jgi:hypothetical protein
MEKIKKFNVLKSFMEGWRLLLETGRPFKKFTGVYILENTPPPRGGGGIWPEGEKISQKQRAPRQKKDKKKERTREKKRKVTK